MKKILKFLQNLFSKSVRLVRKYVLPGIETVENFKKLLDSSVIDVLTAIIPGDLDDAIKRKLRQILPEILLKLKIADECSRYTEPEQVIACALKHIQAYHPDARKAYYLNIAVMITHALADGKLQWHEVVHLVEYTYQEKYKHL
jgi:hypothetical protein